ELEESKPIDLHDMVNDRKENAPMPSAYQSREPEPHDGHAVDAVPARRAPVLDTAGNGDVMQQYHSLMARFLETERAVILTYLGQPDRARTPSGTAWPLESVAVESTSARPLPTNGSSGDGLVSAAPAPNGADHPMTDLQDDQTGDTGPRALSPAAAPRA